MSSLGIQFHDTGQPRPRHLSPKRWSEHYHPGAVRDERFHGSPWAVLSPALDNHPSRSIGQLGMGLAISDTMPVFFLAAGVLTLMIKQQERGAKLDKLLITNAMDIISQD